MRPVLSSPSTSTAPKHIPIIRSVGDCVIFSLVVTPQIAFPGHPIYRRSAPILTMSWQCQKIETLNTSISGGKGGKGGAGGGTGGSGGKGEAPIVTIDVKAVGNLITNNIGGSITIQNDRLVEDLEKWLGIPPDTKDRQQYLRSLQHKGTGRWLLRERRFANWMATPGPLWIKGISGTGKSVLSSAVIEEIIISCPERPAVAYFYFDFNERQRMDMMLRSIIWQLSGRSPSPHGTLHRLYETLGNGTVQPQYVHLQGALEDLLSELDRT
ncbi:hypothetical protein C8R43DRAFT_306269 [Mycena crocata]|nr:hypothetical protein C8R43DRAFT_306269 [Mycena crocata]